MRRDFVAGELAAGRNPADALRALLVPPAPRMTVSAWTERYLDSRIDVGANTLRNYKVARKKVGDTFGDRDPESITVADVTGWVSELAEKHKPGTIGLYVLTFRMLLDYVGTEPNPLRDPRVRAAEADPGRAKAAVRRTLHRNHRDDGEETAATLPYGRTGRPPHRRGRPRCAGRTSTRPGCGFGFRSRRRRPASHAGCICPSGASTRSRRPARSRIACPSAACSLASADASAYQAMTPSVRNSPRCRAISPHDLAPPPASRCGISRVCRPRELAERAGHARPSMSLDVYSHVMPPDEAPMERILALIEPLERRRRCGPGVASTSKNARKPACSARCLYSFV